MVAGWKRQIIPIVMDNHGAHKTPEVHSELIRSRFNPIYLPASSSWYSSIEFVWSTYKTYLSKTIAENRAENPDLNDKMHLEPMVEQTLQFLQRRVGINHYYASLKHIYSTINN